ncbi:MAG: EboA domain-containing protein [Actinomycetes bacterium]
MTSPREWLDEAVRKVAADPIRIRSLFPVVSRYVGREPLNEDDEQGLVEGYVDDAARVELLLALPLPEKALAEEIGALYWYGDAAERRGVLRGLHLLDAPHREGGIGASALPLVLDALRSNDTRLIAAAVGPYGSKYLDDDMWRQAVLKCVFTGVPLAAVHRLHERADGELARMLVDYARERVAAGRDVPADVWLVLRSFPEHVENSDLPADVRPLTPCQEK